MRGAAARLQPRVRSMRVYLASSWRNPIQPAIVHILRRCGLEVYDFKNPHWPERNGGGFAWSDIDPAWSCWTVEAFRTALEHPTAQQGFGLDFEAMKSCDACVVLLPCGRSAHLEGGWFIGQGRPTYILSADGEEPELMYLMADGIMSDPFEVALALGGKVPES